MIKISFDQMNEFTDAANKWVEKNSGESPFLYAIGKIEKQFAKQIKALQDKLNHDIEDLEADSYATDPRTGFYLKSEKGEKIQSPQLLKEFNRAKRMSIEAQQEKMEKMQFEIEPCFSTNVPKLTAKEARPFLGIIIKNNNKKVGGK